MLDIAMQANAFVAHQTALLRLFGPAWRRDKCSCMLRLTTTVLLNVAPGCMEPPFGIKAFWVYLVS